MEFWDLNNKEHTTKHYANNSDSDVIRIPAFCFF